MCGMCLVSSNQKHCSVYFPKLHWPNISLPYAFRSPYFQSQRMIFFILLTLLHCQWSSSNMSEYLILQYCCIYYVIWVFLKLLNVFLLLFWYFLPLSSTFSFQLEVILGTYLFLVKHSIEIVPLLLLVFFLNLFILECER